MKALDWTELMLPISDEKVYKILKKFKDFSKVNYLKEYLPSDEELLLELVATIHLEENTIELPAGQTINWSTKVFSFSIK